MAPLVLHGPPGTGKTASVHALARELDLELIEVNASDVRNKASINELLGAALGQQSLFFKGNVILVDEADGLSGTKDRGGLQAVLALVKEARYPVIITANEYCE
jgi:replication factor C large subunit